MNSSTSGFRTYARKRIPDAVHALAAKQHTPETIKLKTEAQEGPTIYMITETHTEKIGLITDKSGHLVATMVATQQTGAPVPALYYTDGALYQGQPVIMGAAGICTEGKHAGTA